MATAEEFRLSFEGAGKREEAEWQPQDAVIFFGISLVLGIGCRHILRGTWMPYTVALLIVGIALGSLEFGTHHGLGKIGDGIRIWANINPDLLLSVFLPALLFESSFAMEVHQIKRCFMQMLLLAGPGVLVSTFFLGTALKVTFPYGWSYKTSLLLGGLLSATDPVAVVALLKELGASKKLSTIIEGESLMNDGTAIVVYQLFYKMVLGKSFNVGDIIRFLSLVSLGALALGLLFGIASVLWLGFIFNDVVIEITLTLAISYITFYTAQDGFDVSGVLAVMTLGIFLAAVARTAFKGDGQESLHHFWEMVAYIANTLIFILSGVVIAEGILDSDSHFERHGSSWGYLVLLYVYVQLSRVLVVGLLYPFLRHFGYGLDWKESVILVWSGLRGAVALSLSLSVRQASGMNQKHLTKELGTLFVFFTGGIVFLTLIVNGSTTQFLLHFLGMDKLSAAKVRILKYTKYEMLNKALEAFGDLGDDEELGPADWPTVRRYITCLSNMEGNEHPHDVSESEEHLKRMNVSDMRVRLLNGVQAAYWTMLDEGRISQGTATLLMRSVDEAIDLVSSDPLSDWKGLKSNVHFPGYYKFLQMSRLPQRLVTFIIVERLESACSLCAAFLRAHGIARRKLHDFIGDSEIASVVINESSEEGQDARMFLEDIRITFPEVLRVVKTRQVTYSVLKHLSEYVQNLEKVGLLEEKEMVHLDDAVQSDFKRLLRNPPLVKMPKVSDLIGAHPLLGALPADVRELLSSSTEELIKVRGTTLYKEGSRPNGIWLISMGVVKWESRSLDNKHSLHPTFSHGNTLGLYEVLLGKPYMCNMITDSVVHCFFFESEKIPLLRSDPAIEGFLWQESSLCISKILLPQIFEKMSMHELRALVTERSSMNIYISGEVIEIRSNFVGLLLEGFIRNEDVQHEFITSPAALLPSYSNLDIVGSESPGFTKRSFCHSGSCYHVETRARVIFFDLGAVELDHSFQKRTVSKLSLSAEPPRSFTKEHEGLMSWPEILYRARSSNEADVPQASLSARAMELSIYGSMVNDMPMHLRSFQSFQRSSQMGQNHSLSYPRVPTGRTNPRPLVSVRSEGGSMNRRRLGSQEFARIAPRHPMPVRTGRNVEREDSSDESGGEEVIVRIDSPSTLSFRHAS